MNYNPQYKTLAECEAVIQTFEAVGQPIPDWVMEQRNRFVYGTTAKSIYMALRHNSKFPYSDELVKCINDTVDNLLVDKPNAKEPGLLLGKIQC